MGRKDACPEYITIEIRPRQDQKASGLMDSTDGQDNLDGSSCVQEAQKCSGMQFVHYPEVLHSHLKASSTSVVAGTASWSQLVCTSSVRAEFRMLIVHKQLVALQCTKKQKCRNAELQVPAPTEAEWNYLLATFWTMIVVQLDTAIFFFFPLLNFMVLKLVCCFPVRSETMAAHFPALRNRYTKHLAFRIDTLGR